MYTGPLSKGEFKFTKELHNWGTIFRPADVPSEIEADAEGNVNFSSAISSDGTDDRKWVITVAGEYTITVNPTEETISVVRNSAITGTVYGIGNTFFPESAGNSDTACDMEYKSETESWEYTATIPQGSWRKIKFCMDRAAWDQAMFLVPSENKTISLSAENPTTTESIQLSKQIRNSEGNSGGLMDNHWEFPEGLTGTCTVSVNLNTLTVTFTYNAGEKPVFDENPDNVYMLGGATGVWFANESNENNAMVNEGNGIHTKELSLAYNGENKLFKFATGVGEWNQVWYLIPEEATQDGYIKTIDHEGTNTYKLKESSELDGTLYDSFFGLPEGKTGDYKLEVNIPARTLTTTLITDTTGVEEISVENEECEYYNIQGIRVSGTPEHGIYVERRSNGTSRLVKF